MERRFVMRYFALTLTTTAVTTLGLGTMSAQSAVTLDGQNVGSDATSNGLTQLAVQDTATQFGDATGGGQDSAGGSELDAMWAGLGGGTLNLSITGNLEGNFNKGWILFDAVNGGENPMAGDNVDGGFGEINELEGLSFNSGFTPDHGMRLEIGSGFTGINFFDLIDNTASTVYAGGGPGDLPLSDAGNNNGVTFGWDNSNVLGVDGSSAGDALTATKGWEFEIDTATAFDKATEFVGITAFISNGDGTFVSNQVLPGIGGGGNLGEASDDTIGSVSVPSPSAMTTGLLLVGGVMAFAGRRRVA
jgi:hypothetical protein